MKRSVKIAWGIATVVPLAMMALGILILAISIVFMVNHSTGKGSPEEVQRFLIPFVAAYMIVFLSFILGFMVKVSYFVHLIRTDLVDKNAKTVWGVLFLFFNTLPMIPYFIMVVWPSPEGDPASAAPPVASATPADPLPPPPAPAVVARRRILRPRKAKKAP